MDPVTMTALFVANGVMAAKKAEQQAAMRKQEAAMRAAETEASPWTGRGPSTAITTPSSNVWADLGGAAVNSLGQYASLKKSGMLDPSDATSNAAAQTQALEMGDIYNQAPVQGVDAPNSMGGFGGSSTANTLYKNDWQQMLANKKGGGYGYGLG